MVPSGRNAASSATHHHRAVKQMYKDNNGEGCGSVSCMRCNSISAACAEEAVDPIETLQPSERVIMAKYSEMLLGSLKRGWARGTPASLPAAPVPTIVPTTLSYMLENVLGSRWICTDFHVSPVYTSTVYTIHTCLCD